MFGLALYWDNLIIILFAEECFRFSDLHIKTSLFLITSSLVSNREL